MEGSILGTDTQSVDVVEKIALVSNDQNRWDGLGSVAKGRSHAANMSRGKDCVLKLS